MSQLISTWRWLERRWIWAIVWPLFFGAPTTINAFSVLSESVQRGWSVQTWEPFAWEYTSLIGSLVAVIPFTAILTWAWPSRSWRRLLMFWLVAASLYTLTHVLLMVLAREALYAAVGGSYDFGDWITQGFYEARKDFVTCLMMAGVVGAVQIIRELRRTSNETPPAAAAPAFVYSIGGRVYRTSPQQLVYVRAAGHYVEIASPQGVHLVRRSLSDVERALQGTHLVRTHRSWLVNLDRVERVDPRASGDWDLVLAGGETAPLSRRYRQALDFLRGRGFNGPALAGEADACAGG